jgi:hypothetical protein
MGNFMPHLLYSGGRGPYNRMLERSQNLSRLTGGQKNLLSQMEIKP